MTDYPCSEPSRATGGFLATYLVDGVVVRTHNYAGEDAAGRLHTRGYRFTDREWRVVSKGPSLFAWELRKDGHVYRVECRTAPVAPISYFEPPSTEGMLEMKRRQDASLEALPPQRYAEYDEIDEHPIGI